MSKAGSITVDPAFKIPRAPSWRGTYRALDSTAGRCAARPSLETSHSRTGKKNAPSLPAPSEQPRLACPAHSPSARSTSVPLPRARPWHTGGCAPASIGGDVLAYTCKRCNNILGARVDNHLVAWWHSELFDITVQAPGVPGPRSLGLTALRWMGEDVVLAPRRGLPPAFDDLPAGATKITALLESAREPDLVRVQLAVLKSSYLAACLTLGGIPNSPCARAIRGGLLHVREADDLPTAGFHIPVRRYPGGETRQPSRLALIDGEVWVSLAGVLLTPWPICDVPPLWRGGTTPTQPVDASGCALAR